MTHFLERKDPWGHRMGLWMVVLMVAILPPAAWALKGIRLNNDIKNWVPSDDPNVLTLDWYHDNFPSSESVLMTWEGSTLNDPRINWLAGRLEGVTDADGARHGGLKHVEKVIRPQQLVRRIEKEDIPQDEAFARLRGILIGTGPLKLKLTDAGLAQKDAVLNQLKLRLQHDLKIETAVLAPAVAWTTDRPIEDFKLPQFVLDQPAEAAFPAIPVHDAQLHWREMQPRGPLTEKVLTAVKGLQTKAGEPAIQEAFFFTGSPVAVAVVLSESGEADTTESLKEIRQVAEEVGIPSDSLRLAGRPVANSELNQAVKRAAWNRQYPLWNFPGRSLLLLSGAVGIGLAFWALRSAPLTCVVLFVSYYVVGITVALVPTFGGSMNMVLVVMPTLLFVTTLETSIHLANYWRFCAKDDPKNAVVKAVRMATVPTFLASFMSATGLASLMTSTLTPVYDFGKYAAIGSMIAFVVVLYGMPALLGYLPMKAARGGEEEASSVTWERIAGFLVRKHGMVSATCIAAAIACSAGLQWFRTETKAIRYFPESSRVVQDYRFIEENIGGVIPIDIVIRFDQKLRASNIGQEADAPGSEEEAKPANEQQKLLFAERQEIVRRIQNRLVAQHPDISGTVSLATFRPVIATEELATRRASGVQRRLDSTTEKRVIGPASGGRSFVVHATEAKQLPHNGVTLCEAGDELWRVTAQVNIMTDTDYTQLTKDIHSIIKEETENLSGVNQVVTGMVPLFLETQQAILSSMISSFWVAFITIWLTMAVVLRNPLAGLIAMIPNALPVSVVFGLVSWLGVAIDVGTMITASIALGVSVDGSIHMLTWFQEGISRGRTRRVAIVEALGHCGPAMCQTAFVVGLGLLVLYPAELTLISRFGWLMAAMVAAAWMGTVIWLPALMGGWLGTAVMRQAARAKEKRLAKETAQTAMAAAAVVVAATPGTAAASVPSPHFDSVANAPSVTTNTAPAK